MITTTSTTTATATPSRAEQRLRDAEVARLKESAAQTGEPEHYRYLIQRAKKVQEAIPVCCHIQRQRELRERIAGASHRTEVGSEGNLISEAGIYRAISDDLEEENRYPNGLEADVDRAFLGRAITADADEIVGHHRARHG
jgi:hypothetical protein